MNDRASSAIQAGTFFLAVAMWSCFGASEAHAEPEAHHQHDVRVVGKIVSGTSRALAGTAPLFGPGADIEFAAPFGLEVEIATALLLGSADEGKNLTQGVAELLIKKPMRLSRTSEVFLGAGPALNLLASGGDEKLAMGFATVIGAYLWQDEHVALMVEFAYGAVFEHDIAHDVEGAVGVVYGF